MDASLSSLADAGRVVPPHNPSILIVEPNSSFLEIFPRVLKSLMPEVACDLSDSQDDGIGKLETGAYHTVISDVRVAETAGYSLLKRAQARSCPVPVLISQKHADGEAVARVLAQGAFDLIRSSCRGAEVSRVITRALWLYRLRLTIHNRRQRLQDLRLHHETSPLRISDNAVKMLSRTIRNIEEADMLCRRTIHQIESSLHVLEKICRQAESEARESAMRMARFL